MRDRQRKKAAPSPRQGCVLKINKTVNSARSLALIHPAVSAAESALVPPSNWRMYGVPVVSSAMLNRASPIFRVPLCPARSPRIAAPGPKVADVDRDPCPLGRLGHHCCHHQTHSASNVARSGGVKKIGSSVELRFLPPRSSSQGSGHPRSEDPSPLRPETRRDPRASPRLRANGEFSERISETKRDQRQRGRYLGGTVPFGWRVSDDGNLIEDIEQQQIIADILGLHRDGLSLRAIAVLLEQRGVKLSHAGIKKIIDRVTP